LPVYKQRLERPRFFTSLFQTPEANFHNNDTVEYDIIRQGQDIAVAVVSQTSGSRRFEVKTSVNKGWNPVTYLYETSINAAEINKRMPGNTTFDEVDFQEAATDLSLDAVQKLETMIRDAIELDCAEVMQTGTLTKKDESNNTIGDAYDFAPLDATGTIASGDLMVTTATDWAADGATGDPLGDLEGLADNMRARGYNPVKAVFGSQAWTYFLKNSTVLARFNLLNANFGQLQLSPEMSGASRVGNMMIGTYPMELWVSKATYKNPYGGAVTPYMTTDKVLLVADARRDLTFGGISKFPNAIDQRATALLPPRMSFPGAAFDISLAAYFDLPGRNLTISGGTRPLPIPTAIDSFACLDTVA